MQQCELIVGTLPAAAGYTSPLRDHMPRERTRITWFSLQRSTALLKLGLSCWIFDETLFPLDGERSPPDEGCAKHLQEACSYFLPPHLRPPPELCSLNLPSDVCRVPLKEPSPLKARERAHRTHELRLGGKMNRKDVKFSRPSAQGPQTLGR